MANRTLSDLPVVTVPAGADILHTRQSLTDKSISMALISQFAFLNSDYAPIVESVTGTSYTIGTGVRKRILIASISSNCTLTFPGTYGGGYEIIIQNLASSTANVIGLPNSEILYPGQEIVFIWDGSSFVKRTFLNHTIVGTSSPSVTPDFIGQRYINTSSGVIFVAIGTASSSDWKDIINILNSIHSITDSNYTITDTDGYDIIEVSKTTSSGTNTITLPTVADNAGRKLLIKLNQQSTGYADYLIIDGEGAETIEGNATWQMNGAGDFLSIISNGTEWKVVDFQASYETQRINRSDWTNVIPGSVTTLNTDSNITHNLGVNIKKLNHDFLISETDSDNGLFSLFGGWALISGTGNRGYNYYNVDDNNILCQTGQEGVYIIQTPGGIGLSIDTENWYYKHRIFRTTI